MPHIKGKNVSVLFTKAVKNSKGFSPKKENVSV
jgi:hypothetical protein